MDLKKTIEGRVKGMYEDLLVFQTDIKEKSKEMEEVGPKLAMKKKEIGEDGDFMEIKNDLLEAQRIFYITQLVDLNIKHTLSKMSELSILAGLAGIKLEDLEVEEDAISVMKTASNDAKNLFKAEGGKMVVADKEMYDFIMKSFEENAGKEENIKKSFESIQVK